MSDVMWAALTTILSALLLGFVIWIGRGVITGHWIPYMLE